MAGCQPGAVFTRHGFGPTRRIWLPAGLAGFPISGRSEEEVCCSIAEIDRHGLGHAHASSLLCQGKDSIINDPQESLLDRPTGCGGWALAAPPGEVHDRQRDLPLARAAAKAMAVAIGRECQ